MSRSLLRELRYKPMIYEPTVTRKVLFFSTRNTDAAGFSEKYVPHYTVLKHSDIRCWAEHNDRNMLQNGALLREMKTWCSLVVRVRVRVLDPFK